MTALSPGQAAFGRDMLFDYPANVDWLQQQERPQLLINKANQRENDRRDDHEYQSEDLVMVVPSDQRAPKLQQLFDGPYRVFSVRNDGVLVIDKNKFLEKIHIRRIKPFQPPTMEEDVVPS